LSTNGSPPAPTLIVARAAEPCEVLEAGAAGFVPEDAALTTILEAIEQVAQAAGSWLILRPRTGGRRPTRSRRGNGRC
jgi:DNA-binding NarL/FixJ family response regulator